MALVEIDPEDAQPRKKFFGLFRMKGASKTETTPLDGVPVAGVAPHMPPAPTGAPPGMAAVVVPAQAVPGSPVVPGAAGVPGAPVVPGTVGVPGAPVVPGTAGVPGVPVSPGTPVVPGVPVSPGTAAVPGDPALLGDPAAHISSQEQNMAQYVQHQGMVPGGIPHRDLRAAAAVPGVDPAALAAAQAAAAAPPGVVPAQADPSTVVPQQFPVDPSLPPQTQRVPAMPAQPVMPGQPGVEGMPMAGVAGVAQMAPGVVPGQPVIPGQPGIPGQQVVPDQHLVSGQPGNPEQQYVPDPSGAGVSMAPVPGVEQMPTGTPAATASYEPVTAVHQDPAAAAPTTDSTAGTVRRVDMQAAVEEAPPLSPEEALALTSSYMHSGDESGPPPDVTAETQRAIPLPPVVVPVDDVAVAPTDVATIESESTTAPDPTAASSRGEAIANMAVMAATDLMSFDAQVSGSPAAIAATPVTPAEPQTTTPAGSPPETQATTATPAASVTETTTEPASAAGRGSVRVEVAGDDDANLAQRADAQRPGESSARRSDHLQPSGAIDFFSIEVDLQPIERAIRRNDPVRSIMARGPERYLPFLVRALAIAGPKFPEMLTTHRKDRLDFLMRIIDDASPATYPLIDVGNRRLSSIAEEISIRNLETPDDTGTDCPVSIATVNRPGPSMGFISDPDTRRVALTLTGVEHRPVATTDRLGCSAMAVHATAFLGASFSHEVSWSRREPFIDELKRIVEGRDWDTEIN